MKRSRKLKMVYSPSCISSEELQASTYLMEKSLFIASYEIHAGDENDSFEEVCPGHVKEKMILFCSSSPFETAPSVKAGTPVMEQYNCSDKNLQSVSDGPSNEKQALPTTLPTSLQGCLPIKTSPPTIPRLENSSGSTIPAGKSSTQEKGGGASSSSNTSQPRAANSKAEETPPIFDSNQSHVTNNGAGGGGSPPTSNTGSSDFTSSEAGRGQEAQQSSGAGQSDSAGGKNGYPSSSPPFSPQEGNYPLYHQPNKSVEETDPFSHLTADVVVQADVSLIRVPNDDDNEKLVCTLPKVIDPGGKSDLVRCAPYIPGIHTSPPLCSNTNNPKANSSNVHQDFHTYSISLHSIPSSENDDVLYQAKYPHSCSPLSTSMLIAPAFPPHSLLQQERVCSPQPSSHSSSVASSEIESSNDDIYLTEAKESIQNAENQSYLLASSIVGPSLAPYSLSSPQGSISCQPTSSASPSAASMASNPSDEDTYWSEAQQAVDEEENGSLLVLSNSLYYVHI